MSLISPSRFFAAIALAFVLVAPGLSAAETRSFVFEYTTQVGPAEPGHALDVFVPLAASNAQQVVVDEQITASIPGSIRHDDAYGNRYWHGRLETTSDKPIEVTVRTQVERRVSRLAPPSKSRALTPDERTKLAAFLGPNRRVPVDHPILDPIRVEIHKRAGSDDPAAIARAIYDWVIDNVEYKKVGTGWGNGDTFWACNERRGNCTDFHALFISLARSEGIPARFEIGFPVPADRSKGKIAGYHCWVQFYLPEVGWFPIDASEAFKDPARRDYFYGAHPDDRIHMTTGRDLKLGPDEAAKPVNYFVYPHIELDGAAFRGAVENTFRYEDTTGPE